MKTRTKHKAALIRRIMNKLADKAINHDEGLTPEDVKAALEHVYESTSRYVVRERKLLSGKG